MLVLLLHPFQSCGSVHPLLWQSQAGTKTRELQEAQLERCSGTAWLQGWISFPPGAWGPSRSNPSSAEEPGLTLSPCLPWDQPPHGLGVPGSLQNHKNILTSIFSSSGQRTAA